MPGPAVKRGVCEVMASHLAEEGTKEEAEAEAEEGEDAAAVVGNVAVAGAEVRTRVAEGIRMRRGREGTTRRCPGWERAYEPWARAMQNWRSGTQPPVTIQARISNIILAELCV